MTLEYYGSLQGKIHSWYKEAKTPYFDLRELATDRLVKCYYTEKLYRNVYEQMKDRDNVVHVSGDIKADRVERVPEEIKVVRIDNYEPLSKEEFEEFFGE